MGAQTRDIADPACIKARHQRGRWDARIGAHHGHVAEGLPRKVNYVENRIERSIRPANIAGPQTRIQHVTRLGERGDQRVIDPDVVMAILLRLRLVAMNLDRRAVYIERHAGYLLSGQLGPDAAAGKFLHRLAQHLEVGRLRHRRDEP
jgi:hypothetical protein